MNLLRTPSTCRGAVDPRLLLGSGLMLVAVILWVFLSGPAKSPTSSDSAPIETLLSEGKRPQAGSLEMEPSRPLRGVGPLQVELLFLGSRDDSLVSVQRPGVLVGTIYDSRGEKAEGVELRIEGGPQDGITAYSDAEGSFRLEGLIPGLHFVRLQSRTIPAVVRMHRVLAQRETRRDFFLGQTLSVQLHVRNHKGKDLEGAVVRSDLGLHQGVTDEKGLVLLDNVSGGRRVVLDIRADDHVPVRYEMNLFASLVGSEPIELPPLPIGGKVRGRVKSWPGGSLPTITLVPRASKIGAFQVVWEEWQGVTTDREGRFQLEDVPIDHLLDIRAFHPQGVCDPRVRAVRPSKSSPANADFVIRQANATVNGDVVDANGKPLSTASLRLEAVRPGQVLAALYPGLTDSPVGVRLPVPAQLLRKGRPNQRGKFEFALGDHPKGTGHLLLTVAAKGKRTVRREVKVVGKSFHIVMQDARYDASLKFKRSDDGPIPETQVMLNGEARESMQDLEEGFYRVLVKRGDLVLKQVDKLWIQGATELDLRP